MLLNVSGGWELWRTPTYLLADLLAGLAVAALANAGFLAEDCFETQVTLSLAGVHQHHPVISLSAWSLCSHATVPCVANLTHEVSMFTVL